MSQVTAKVRKLCFARDGGKCLRCLGGRPSEQLHHRRPRGMGSSSRDETNLPANLVSLCARCHREVESDRATALMEGWIVMQSQMPSTVPLRTPRGRIMLDNEGRVHELV